MPTNEEWGAFIDKFQGDTKYPMLYSQCERQGHYFEVEPWRWFRYGWRWPWRSRMWLKCKGCGIATLLPPEVRRFPGSHRP